ncbi:glycine/betaine ABC transporter substrate-binding protein [Actinocatenispora thailandica]|uniref:Glycine/betaine ABC transporter substrate-binding protein n=1 Tax=Actinocatenispora thailandica TaxID=227318 RepID=A0A7R7DS57_9ACTN|nr:glycine betaine ABC transporter substrate-binding protein [Actinocatenispora thailandica]BCJ36900.1 glycine/betaine ABC transporter substrate-binding protein [Actinocatenispora thailandica]
MRSRTRIGILAAVLAGVALVTTGCGLRPASQFAPNVTGKSIKADSLKGAKLSVTSKDFTEQILLGKITVLALKAAGADVTDKTNVQGSTNARNLLLKGGVDMQWEYTGTAWITYMKQEHAIPDSEKQYEAVKKKDLADNGVDWLPWAHFNNTYAIAVTAASAKKYGLKKLSDIKTKVPANKRTWCVESEFYSRSDGFFPLLKKYGLPKPPNSQVKKLDTGVVYTETARGGCLFGEVFDTDGRIPALNLTTLADDRHAEPLYNPALTIRHSVYQKYPQILPIEKAIAAKLSTPVMRRLNAKVDVDGQEPVLVARDWLRSEGFIQ